MYDTANSRLGVAQAWRAPAAAALTATSLGLVVLAPRGNIIALALLIAAALTALGSKARPQAVLRLTPVACGGLALGLWALASVLWTLDRGESAVKALTLLALVLAVQLGANAAAEADPGARRAITKAAIATTVASVAFLLVEVLLGQPLHKLVFAMLPMLRPDPKHLQLGPDGSIIAINPYVLNRHLGAFVLTVAPVLLMAARSLADPARVSLIALVTAGTAVAVFRSEHETSMLAIVAALITFAGMRFAPRAMRILVAAAWVAATILVVPIASLAYSSGLHTATWIPTTGRNRIILWGVTAKEIAKSPMIGIGPASTKELDAKSGPTAPRPEDHTYALRTGRHAHNVYMQTWYELGAVGAVLLLTFGLLGLRAITRLSPDAEPYAVASFVVAAVVGAFSWGMWQAWFMAAFGLWIVLLSLAAADGRPDEQPVA